MHFNRRFIVSTHFLKLWFWQGVHVTALNNFSDYNTGTIMIYTKKIILIQWGQEMHIYISKLSHHWLR